MPTTNVDNTLDAATDLYSKNLERVMSNFRKRVIDIASSSKLGARDQYDLATFAINKQEMVTALTEAGYLDLAQDIVGTYNEISQEVKQVIKAVGGPDFKYSQIDRKTFSDIAAVDLSKFADLGTSGVSELHYQLFNQAVVATPFSEMVAAIEAATTGVMTHQAKTLANTAILSFSGQSMIKAGEEVGFDDPQSEWRVQGPLDSITRDACRDALANRVRTREEWESIDYFGGAPGGWNCRHWLVPYFGDDVEEVEAAPIQLGPTGEGLPAQKVELSGIDGTSMKSISSGLESSVVKYGGSLNTLSLLPKNKKYMGLARGKNIELNRTEITKAKERSKERHSNWLANKEESIAATRKSIADPRRKSIIKSNEAKLESLMASKQFTIYNVASDPAAAIVTHEGFHNVYNVRELKSKWESAVKAANVSGSEMMAVSEYGASSLAELFAEVGTAIEHNIEIPANLKSIFLEVVK